MKNPITPDLKFEMSGIDSMEFTVFTRYDPAVDRKATSTQWKLLNRYANRFGVRIIVFYGKDCPADDLKRTFSALRWWRLRGPLEESHVLFLDLALRQIGTDIGVYCAPGVIPSWIDLLSLANAVRENRDIGFSWLNPRPLKGPALGAARHIRMRTLALRLASLGYWQDLIRGGLNGKLPLYQTKLYALRRPAFSEMFESLNSFQKKKLAQMDLEGSRQRGSARGLTNFFLIHLIGKMALKTMTLPHSTSRFFTGRGALFRSYYDLFIMIRLSLKIRQKIQALTQIRFFFPVMQVALWGALFLLGTAPAIAGGMFLFYLALSVPVFRRFPEEDQNIFGFLGYVIASLVT